MTVPRIRRALVAAALLTLAMGSIHASNVGDGLIDSGPAPELFLVYTGDVIGYIDPCG